MIHARRLFYVMLLALLVLPVVGCSPDSEDGTGDETTTYTVVRGDITAEVSASGNLAFSTTEDLAFDMEGTVEDVFVEEGDVVTEGQVVATLDTADWEDQLRSLRISLLSAKSSLKQAEYTLDELESETSTSITGDVVVRDCCDDEDIELQEMQVEQARMRLEDAQAKLDEHLAQSPEVAAPFDGFVTSVSAEGGDEVFKGSVAVTIADPDRFEVLIYVSENDIAQISEGMEAEVTIDTLSLVLPASVTSIAPTATVSSGVVNYEVTVEVATLEAYSQQVQDQMAAAQQQMADARQQMQQQLASGEMPDQLKQAVESGQMTQEEAEAVMQQMQSGDSPQGMASDQVGSPATMLEGIQLREGLSVSVTLIVAEKADVLVVPNASISTRRGQAFVTVVAADGSEEERQVTTGLSDWQSTEIIDGLEEGEVIKTTGTVVATDGFDGRPGGGMVFMGGGPR
jgi:RND family efflux transporter MFP subunit